MWTLYQFGGSNQDVLNVIKNSEILGVVMPQNRVDADLLADLRDRRDIVKYVHTINDQKRAGCLVQAGATGLYTDTLTQENLSSLGKLVCN